MALISEVGVGGLSKADGYWRVGALSWSAFEPNNLHIRVDGYASQQSFESGEGAIVSTWEAIELPLDQAEDQRTAAFDGVRTLVYGYLKQQQFQGAIDA